MGAGREQVAEYLSSELSEIIGRAYPIFAVPAPASIGVCTACCMDPDLAHQMLATPAERMTLDHIQEWYDAAKQTDLPLTFVYWHLPRTLDFLAQGKDVAMVGNEIAFAHFTEQTQVPQWPDPQRELFMQFACAFMDARLDQKSPELDANLCMIAKSGIDMTLVLDRLNTAHPLRLAKAILANSIHGVYGLGNDAFWTDGPAREAVRNWPQNAGIADRLMQWTLTQDDDTAEVIWQAVDLIP